MDRTLTPPIWFVLLAALSELATAAPSRADAGLFDFDSASLAEQTTEVDPAVLDGTRHLQLEGVQIGSIQLGLNVQRAAAAPDSIPSLRYTVADAQRDWLRAATSSQGGRLSLSAMVNQGSARGISFQISRDDGGEGSSMDSRLAFSRAGFSAAIRLRNVGSHFARSSLMSDADWNAVKDDVGWRQTDMDFKWQALPGLSLATHMDRGTKSDSGENRDRRRFDLAWATGRDSHLTLYNERNETGSATTGSRTTKSGFAWTQTLRGLSLGISQDMTEASGQSGRTRTLSFATPPKSRASLAYTRTNVESAGVSSVNQTLHFHARPTSALDLQTDLAMASGSGPSRTERNVRVNWKPTSAWKFDGSWHDLTGASTATADFHLEGDPGAGTHFDARLQETPDANAAYRRQQTVRIERHPKKALQWTLQYASLETKAGQTGEGVEATGRLQTSLGLVTAACREGDSGVQPSYTELGYASTDGKGQRLGVKARIRGRENAADTQILDVTWKVSDRLTLDGGYRRNEEDQAGAPQDMDSYRVAVHCRFADGLQLDVSHSLESRPDGRTECTDMTLKGKIDTETTLDVGAAFHLAVDKPRSPAYHVDIQHDVDDDHRFHLAVARETRAVQKCDNLTASLDLITDF
jgi:hypothetical protein